MKQKQPSASKRPGLIAQEPDAPQQDKGTIFPVVSIGLPLVALRR